jgi:hypothetical protein
MIKVSNDLYSMRSVIGFTMISIKSTLNLEGNTPLYNACIVDRPTSI